MKPYTILNSSRIIPEEEVQKMLSEIEKIKELEETNLKLGNKVIELSELFLHFMKSKNMPVDELQEFGLQTGRTIKVGDIPGSESKYLYIQKFHEG